VTVDLMEMALRLLAALAAGSAIGYERSFHGRPAGFRTHALVCMASALLMLVTVYEAHWMRQAVANVTLDPTRMAQGIMTGIGFLGAGAIMKDGLSVRGLTTAASIWMTSAIGILAGIGFYYPLALAVALTLGVLSLFRWVEAMMPTHAYYHFEVRLAREGGMEEEALRTLVEQHGFSAHNFSYRLDGEGRVRRYSTVIRAGDRKAAGRLSQALHADPAVQEYRIAPTGD
jgi:putative Mg2+ transporter-C (MgtC) family protein